MDSFCLQFYNSSTLIIELGAGPHWLTGVLTLHNAESKTSDSYYSSYISYTLYEPLKCSKDRREVSKMIENDNVKFHASFLWNAKIP